MVPRAGGQQGGLSILELTLTLLMIAVLIVLTLEGMIHLRVEIERAAVERNLGAMRSALTMKFAQLRMDGRVDRIRDLAGSNPMALMDSEPGIPGSGADEVGPGEWSFDAEAGHIVYRPAHPEALTGDPDAVGRWRVRVVGDASPQGVRLVTVEPLGIED